jgi:hypothetical protein
MVAYTSGVSKNIVREREQSERENGRRIHLPLPAFREDL